ncbi:hypothetical protein ACFL4W_00510 [Planctomycetota bacterium]
MRKQLILLPALLAFIWAGCGGSGSNTPSPRIKDLDGFYLKAPTERLLAYSLETGDGSRARGTVRINIAKVTWPEKDTEKYSMSGSKLWQVEGKALTKADAIAMVPDKDLKKAMDPANIREVYRLMDADDKRKMGIAGSAAVIVTDHSRIKDLKLPIKYSRTQKTSRFSSRLKNSMDLAEELALVWFKILLNELMIPVPASFDVKDAAVSDQGLTMKITVKNRLGVKHGTYFCSFTKDLSLKSVRAELESGIEIKLGLD